MNSDEFDSGSFHDLSLVELLRNDTLNNYVVFNSRKQYTEEQAEKWWAENETRLCKQHNIRTT